MSTLTDELTGDPLGRGYDQMTVEEVLASTLVKDITVVYQRFISLRGCAAELSDVEYAGLKSFLATVSALGPRYADMVDMLGKPCCDGGDTGGLDFGCDDVRDFLDQFGQVEGMGAAAVKLKALAEKQINRQEQLGESWRLVDIIRARRAIQ